jgi:hypothetical protein
MPFLVNNNIINYEKTFKITVFFFPEIDFVSGYLYTITMNIKTLNTKKAGKILDLPKGDIVYPHAIVNTKKGLATVSFEGVGWFEDDGSYTVLCGGEYDSYYKTLTRDQLISLTVEERDMTLNKLIDPHNDRTRSNLWLWENQIKNIDQNVVGSVYNGSKGE